MPLYNRAKICFEYGEGAYIYDTNGKKYLDFAAGIAVNSLGHSHPHVVNALIEQARKFWHCSNLYEIPGLNKFAERLVNASFADTVFFCNSGAEAIECGIKMVRKYHDETGNPDKYCIITFKGAFHGRTMAAVSASDPEKLIKGFEPALDGFDNIEFLDLDAVRNAINDKTAAILIEPIQGEGGVRTVPISFMQELRKLCDENGLLLFLDEIQCGMGRTGKLFAHEWAGIKPDIIAVAKGIGAGFPLGACMATERAAIGMKQGSHGSTYSSNPLAMKVGNAVLDIILSPGFMESVHSRGVSLQNSLSRLKGKFPSVILDVRGMGLMLGIKLKPLNTDVVNKLREKGLLTAAAADNVVRILPPLIVEESHIVEAEEKLEAALKEYV